VSVSEIDDPVYGKQSVTDQVLVEIIHSAAMRRLRGIHQSGGSWLVRRDRDGSRYEHCVGVMLLIRTLGGSLTEQVAGLIHDVSHTAFSHVIDQVFARRDEDYHEHHFERLVLESDIPAILARHDVPIQEVLDIERWSLLEQPHPDLCADRIDYTLRDLLRIGFTTPQETRDFLSALTVREGKTVLTDLQAAIWFERQYRVEVGDLFMHPLEIYADEQLACAIRLALARGILSEDDLFGQDEDVMRRLRSANDPEISAILSTLHEGITVIEDDVTFDVRAHVKARVVDPLVLTPDDRVVRCSELVPSIRAQHDEIRRKASRGIAVRLIQ
jgi:HD superfamily phosphohydrolase